MQLDINHIIHEVSIIVAGWPLIIFLGAASFFCTIAFGFVQFRYFLSSWKMTLFPSKDEIEKKEGQLSPLQAFLNSLGMSMGNGVLAGVATAIYAGGPGSLLWLFLTGMFLMSVRFAEVYLSLHFKDAKAHVGGPMVYIKKLLGGRYLAYIYAIFAFLYALAVGNAIQTNAISLSVQTVWNTQPIIVAVLALIFTLYVMLGGAKRIIALSDALVSLKVILFFISVFIVLSYHWQEIIPSLVLIFNSAFSYAAFAGGTLGFTVQQAVRFGMLRSLMSSEAGLGTSGIIFGSIDSNKPMEDSLMAMLTVFISSCICFILGLAIIACGVWQAGHTSTALVITSFNTVFGSIAGWVVVILSIAFGSGLIVSYGFVAQNVWGYLTGGRFALIGSLLYCSVSFLGALVNPHVLWLLGDIINAGMILINISALIILSNVIKSGLKAYAEKNKIKKDVNVT